jgi:hypothetical protein
MRVWYYYTIAVVVGCCVASKTLSESNGLIQLPPSSQNLDLSTHCVVFDRSIFTLFGSSCGARDSTEVSTIWCAKLLLGLAANAQRVLPPGSISLVTISTAQSPIKLPASAFVRIIFERLVP